MVTYLAIVLLDIVLYLHPVIRWHGTKLQKNNVKIIIDKKTSKNRIYEKNFPKKPFVLSLKLSVFSKDPFWLYNASNRVFIAKEADAKMSINLLMIVFYVSNKLWE